MDVIEIQCPRCGKSSKERFYGPCATCRETLRSELAGEQTDVAAVEYEPKMNVVPNQIATKE